MSDRTDKFSRLLKDSTPYPPLEPPAAQDGVPQLIPKRKPYVAIDRFKSGEKTERLRLIQSNGDFDFYSYTHLLEGSFRGGLLTLTTTTRSFVLSGKNLDKIVDLLVERKIRVLRAFNAVKHDPVTDGNAIMIEDITREG